MIKPKTPRIWKPKLTRRVFYSEILNEHLTITVTMRLLDLVDEAHGFDDYILSTHEVDIRSALGMTLKRLMLKTLSDKSMYPENLEKRDEIFRKYEKYLVPSE